MVDAAGGDPVTMPVIDLTGQTFGAWTVLRRAASRRGTQAQWLCRCACGTKRVHLSQVLRDGRSCSCGCQRTEGVTRAALRRFGDLTGKTFGALTVQRHSRGQWVCTCAEGHESLRRRPDLRDTSTCEHCENDRIAARARDLHDRYVVGGQSLAVIAQIYSVDLTTVWKWLRSANIPRRPKGAPKGSRGEYAVKRAEAVRRVAAGEVAHHVERDLGLGGGVVSRWCKAEGVPVKRGRPTVAIEVIDNVVARINTSAPAQTPRDLVLDLHAQGVARKTIAHDLGLSVETVGRWIADADRERITRIRAMAHEGVPHAAIAEMFGVSCAYVGLLSREGRERAA